MHPPGTRASTSARWRAGVGVLALVGIVVGLHLLDHPLLSPPDVTDPATWSNWASTVGPVGMLMSWVRMAAIGLSWYLLIAALLQVAAAATGARSMGRLADLLVTARTRDVLVAVVGTSLVASTTLHGVSSSTAATDRPAAAATIDGAAAESGSPPRLVRLDRDEAAPRLVPLGLPGHLDATTVDAVEPPRLRRLDADPAGPVVPALDDRPRLRRLGDDPAIPTMTRLDDVVAGEDDPDAAERDAQWWTVAPGDHFWHVAEEQVALAHDRPSETRVRAYWHCLIEVNRDRLVDPDNPDLLLPGQVLLLPPSGSP